jgi:hypothetical protein
MKALRRFTTLLPMLSIGYCCTGIAAYPQETLAGYVTPTQYVQKKGSDSGYEGEADQRWCLIEGVRHCL